MHKNTAERPMSMPMPLEREVDLVAARWNRVAAAVVSAAAACSMPYNYQGSVAAEMTRHWHRSTARILRRR